MQTGNTFVVRSMRGWGVALLLALLFAGASPAQVAQAANYVVSNTNDSGPGSLRQAILDANANAGADTITFSVSGAIVLGSTLPTISDAAGLTIDGAGQTITISGNDAVLVMVVNNGAALTLKNLTIANGWGEFGGGIDNGGALTVENSTFSGNRAGNGGGGIINSGVLDVTDSTFSDNSAAYYGGGIYSQGALNVTNSTFAGNNVSESGGGIYNDGALNVTNSIFSGNNALSGGGIINFFDGVLNVTNSTFSGNSARSGGGGMYNFNLLNVINSTFADNSAGYAGGGILNQYTLNITNSTFSGNSASGGGGGIFNARALNVTNTIIANSPSGGNCAGGVTDGGGNLVWGDTTCPGIHADPKLLALADNGGATQTMALDAGSAAIDAALPAHCPATDQRGVSRPQGAHCDIGAFEAEQASDSTAPAITITTPPVLGQSINADYVCEDEAGGSGVASCIGDAVSGHAIDTNSVGTKSFTVNAADNAGNTVSLTHHYSVVYSFSGFLQPVDNYPTVNTVNGGQAIPVKFSLGGDQGLDIFASGYPKAVAYSCGSEGDGSSALIEETVTNSGKSSLQYDPVTDTYTYVWKTDKAWAGTCRRLVVKLSDNSEQVALFQFKGKARNAGADSDIVRVEVMTTCPTGATVETVSVAGEYVEGTG